MESDDLRFRHIGLSSDGLVVFCELDNGKTYSMPLCALERAEDRSPEAKPKSASIIHDGYAAVVKFNDKTEIDFPADFVLHICEPAYRWHKDRVRTLSGVGRRVREIREARGLTLDALAAKCGIAKPNLSRLEHEKVTPKFSTLSAIAAAFETHPALLVQRDAWTSTRHAFDEWMSGLLWKGNLRTSPRVQLVRSADMVKRFLSTRPEHRYAQSKLLKHADNASHDAEIAKRPLDAEKWANAI